MSNINVVDSIHKLHERMKAIADLLSAAGRSDEPLGKHTSAHIGDLLGDMAIEADALMEHLDRENRKPRIVAGGES